MVKPGRLAKEAHVRMQMQATTGNAALTEPDGTKAFLINVGVLVVPRGQHFSTVASPAVVTYENRESAIGAHMTAEPMHARFVHRHAEGLQVDA
eukprot:1585342-Pleurochrysis_carterae.AAC.1